MALVIGNSAYPDAATPLPTTIADASVLANELRRSGFDVDLKLNVRKFELRAVIDAFGVHIEQGTIAFFYFSGFALQVDRENYLVPVDASLWTAADVRKDAISIQSVLAEMRRKGAKVQIVVIDAARQNPFERRFRSAAQGLAPIDAPPNSMVMYSAAPGKLTQDGTGPNSLFMSEFIKEFRTASTVTAEELFNRVRLAVSRASKNEQIPWLSSSLVEELYFNTRVGVTPQAPQAPIPRPEAQNVPPPAPSVPEFPWPPPAASASYVFPRGLFAEQSTVGRVAALILSALDRRGYVEHSFFRAGMDGVALVTRLERITEDGSPALESQRWPGALDDRNTTDLRRFLSGLFFVDPGRYRVIVFIFQHMPFAQSHQEVTGDKARAWLQEGLNVLPREMAERSFEEGDCTVLVYEFASNGSTVSRVESRMTGKQHLEKAGLLALLSQNK